LKHRLTRQADDDIRRILSTTFRLFGERQLAGYARVIGDGIALLAEDPFRASSKDRSEIRPAVRSFHLQLVAKRQGAASHIIYYYVSMLAESEQEVIILRVLGDEMEPKRRVASALGSG